MSIEATMAHYARPIIGTRIYPTPQHRLATYAVHCTVHSGFEK